MKNNQLKTGVLLSYTQMFAKVIIGLLYTPIMIKYLGQSEYGLYNTVSSTISMLALLNLGFNSGYIRYYAKYKVENDNKRINSLNGLFLLIFSVIGVVALCCGLFLSFNLKYVFDSGLSSSQYNTAKILAILFTVNLALSFPMSVFSNIINAHERFAFLKIVGMIRTVLTPLASLPVLLMGFKSIGLVVVTLVLSLVADVFYIYYVLFKLRCRFSFKNIEAKVFKGLFGYTLFIAINLVIDQINWNVDKLVLTRYRGTIETAIYSVGYSLYTYYESFSTSICGVFTPRIHKLVNQNKDDKLQQRKVLTEIFTKVGRIQFALLALIASGLIFFGKQFITVFWAGDEYVNSYAVVLLLALPATIALIQNVGIEIQRAQNKHQFRSIAYLIMAICNLVISIILCKKYGAAGSAFGTAVSLIVANGIIMNIYYHKQCNVDILFFWKNIISMFKGLIIPIIVGVVIDKALDLSTIFGFVIGIIIYVIIYAISFWLFSLNNYEKNLVLSVFERLFKRK